MGSLCKEAPRPCGAPRIAAREGWEGKQVWTRPGLRESIPSQADCFWRVTGEMQKHFYIFLFLPHLQFKPWVITYSSHLLLSPFKHSFIHCTKYLHYCCNCVALWSGLTNLQQGLVSAGVLETRQHFPWCSLGAWSPSLARRLAGRPSTWATRA